MYLLFGKRLFDIVWAVFLILLLSPLFFIVSIAILFSDPGPVLFCQDRVGQNGTIFRFYKFRSMPVNTPSLPSDRLGDVRLTVIGRIIRRTSIDELPQLFNILIGDMSIVGPRPPLLEQVELVNLRRLNGSLSLKPGLTGLAQICSFNGMTFSQKAALDARYAKTISLLSDLVIIAKTFPYLLSTPPIY